jgi:hypothetical protein
LTTSALELFGGFDFGYRFLMDELGAEFEEIGVDIPLLPSFSSLLVLSSPFSCGLELARDRVRHSPRHQRLVARLEQRLVEHSHLDGFGWH